MIVGKRKAGALMTFFYERLGCGARSDREAQVNWEQRYLDKIADLETL